MAVGEAPGFVIRAARDRAGPAHDVELYGQGTESEFGHYEHRGIRLLLLGHCLLDPRTRAARFEAAVGSGDLGGVADWPGCYSAVVLHRDHVTGYSDLAGQFPLYYSERDGEILIASDPGFLASRHRREFDRVTAAAHIACPAVLPLWDDRSPYAGVHRVGGGATLRTGAGSPRADRDRRPLPVPGMTVAEGAPVLREALAAAVRDRCADQAVSSDFSGGVDSAAVAFLAARYSSGPVPSIFYHQPLAPAGDMAEAVRSGGLDPRINLTVVRGSRRTLPFSPGSLMSSSSGPTQAMSAAGRGAMRLAAAAASGAMLHLTGEGGDALTMSPPSYLADLACPGHLRALSRHCGAYARLRYVSPARLAWSAARLRRTSPRRALRTLAADLEHPSGEDKTWRDHVRWWPSPRAAASWLTPAIRRELAGIAADPATARSVPDGVGPADAAAWTELQRSGEAQRFMRELARPLGIEVHAPFLDSAVVRAALSVPAVNRADPWSYKPLLRAAVTGLVPDAVLARRTKGDYSAETYRGAREAAAALRGLLRDSRLAALGVIEPGAAEEALATMTAGAPVPLGPLVAVLATEAWLRSDDKARRGVLTGC